jgi:hypothetical protein
VGRIVSANNCDQTHTHTHIQMSQTHGLRGVEQATNLQISTSVLCRTVVVNRNARTRSAAIIVAVGPASNSPTTRGHAQVSWRPLDSKWDHSSVYSRIKWAAAVLNAVLLCVFTAAAQFCVCGRTLCTVDSVCVRHLSASQTRTAYLWLYKHFDTLGH